jgi:DNA-directed RNA polymerase specialized sigma24 family protein
MLDLDTNAEELLAQAHRALRFDPQIGPSLSEDERQDLASDTYERLLRRHREGRIYNGSLASLTQKTALNLARNYLAHRNFQGRGDPTDEAIAGSSEDIGPDETLLRKVDLAGGIEAAEQLPEEQLRVYRALVVDELTPGEAIKRLHMRRSTFFKYRKLAFDHVTSALLDGEDSPAARERLKLLAAYDAGIADARQRARARRLLKNDPSARAELLALRRGHRVAAAGLPMVLVEHSDPGGSAAALGDRSADAVGRARDAVSSLFHRSAAESAEATASITSSGVGRGAGVAGAGVLAKIAALGSGGQVAAACLAGGGATLIACVAAGVISIPGSSQAKGTEREPIERVRPQQAPPTKTAPVSMLPSQLGNDVAVPAPKAKQRKGPGGGDDGGSTPAPESVVDATAPPVEQEFGVASAATPVGGAPPDANDSNGAAASTVRGEFGP